jgi:MoxR-like ATPase
MSTKWTDDQKEQFINHLAKGYGTAVSRGEIIEEAKQLGFPYPRFILDSPEARAGRGMYDISCFSDNLVYAPALAAQVLTMPKPQKPEVAVGNLIPSKESQYVPFGFFKDLKSILQSKIFYPVFITGLSGNGKTTMVEQVCADLKRECIRVNISIETDEDDLIGGNTLINGNIVYREGPVLMAMKRGAVLLIDECDRGSNKLMCMQAIMEGKSYLNKKTGEVIEPAPGFTIIATANTKGRGTEDGRFSGAQMIDDAFLERFAITVEQEFPNSKVEKKIVIGKMQELNCLDPDFADKLVSWADIIRRTFEEGGIDELVSTRRLLHIVKAYAMFNDRQKAIELCTNRFDDETKTAFLDLYSKVDAPAVNPDPAPAPVTMNPNEEIPF